MTDLEQAMWEAWGKVRGMLEENRDELRARVARRRSRMFLRPLRAFCLAVRASDNRINPAKAAMVPEDAMEVSSEWHRGRVVEHEVVLDARLLREICRPVVIEPPGEPADEVARRLGCDPAGLMPLRRNGVLRVHYVKGLLGRRQNVPLVYTPEMLDPSALGKGRPDPIWGCLWQHHAEWLPANLWHALMREPEYRWMGGREKLLGWRWVCPGCKRRVRTVYYPLRVPDWGRYVGFRCAEDEVDALPRPNACFACNRCHGVINFSRASLKKSWNQMVLHYSGGLMYGREVKRPAWLKVERKRAYRARPKPAPRREELTRWLVGTEAPMREIARELGVKYETVRTVAGQIYRQHGVHDREGLRKRMPAVGEGERRSAG